MQDEITWIVAISDPLPPWQGLINVFQYIVWVASLFVYILMVLIVWTVSRAMNNSTNEHRSYQQLSEISFLLWNMKIGVNSTVTPRSTRMRIIIYLWALLCLNWNTAYTTSLVSMMTNPVYIEKVYVV